MNHLWAVVFLSFTVILNGAELGTGPKAVPTFGCVGIYWQPPNGSGDKECEVSYRKAGAKEWNNALPLWFDGRNSEYRGSIVNLKSGMDYEVTLWLKGTETRSSLPARTWSENFPIGRKVGLPKQSKQTLPINESGSPDGYVLYEAENGPGGT